MKLNPSGPRKASPSLRGSALDPLKDRDQMAALRVDMRRRNRLCAMTAIGAQRKLISEIGYFRSCPFPAVRWCRRQTAEFDF